MNGGFDVPSPFPGMNPYLENDAVWHDFHERFIPHVAEVLGQQVDPKYTVRIDEHMYIHELDAETRRFGGRADVSVADTKAMNFAAPAAMTIDAAPATVILPDVDVERVSFIEIRNRHDRSVV